MAISRKTKQTILVFTLFLSIAIFSFYIAYSTLNSSGTFISNILSFSLGYVFADLWELVTCHYLKLDGGQKIGNYHYHHSFLGLLGIIFSLFIYFLSGIEIASLLFFWGVGIITQHTLNENKFVFITKIKD